MSRYSDNRDNRDSRDNRNRDNRNRDNRSQRDNRDNRDRRSAPRRPGRYDADSHQNMSKVDNLIIDIQRKLRDEIHPLNIEHLNAFERKRIHSFFDNKPDFKTKTYRDDDDFVFRVYPIGNLKRFVEQKAQEALDTGNTIQLPAMTSFERFIIHDHLKSWDGIETSSQGEEEERHIEIRPKRFGRTLKKIMKKMKIL